MLYIALADARLVAYAVFQNNIILIFIVGNGKTFNDKISILFDAEQANRERNATLSLQTAELFETQEKLKIRVRALEKKVG